MNVLFLGAGKRLSLLESFLRAGIAEDVDLKLFAVEGSPLVPIAHVAEVLVGPSFSADDFEDFLLSAVRRHRIDLVLPNMDSATVALAAMREALDQEGCWAAVSDVALCSAMFDKAEASAWFSEHGVSQPSRNGFPCIAKSRQGYGARDQFVARDAEALQAFLGGAEPNHYFVQAFLRGQEYTVDAYVDREGSTTAILSRKRLEVRDGEVEVSETHHNATLIEMSKRVLANRGWQGPITLQFIDGPDGAAIIEVNPRFGGGVTHAIHCGLDMPAWLIRERLGRSLPASLDWPNGSVMTRCRRDVFHDPEY